MAPSQDELANDKRSSSMSARDGEEETMQPKVVPAGHLHDAAGRGPVVSEGSPSTCTSVSNGANWFRKHSEPLIRSDTSAEARLRMKIDLYVIPITSLLCLVCFIDRTSIGNAKLAGFEKDIGLTGYDFNRVLTVSYTAYIVFEIPSTVACKWVGPAWYLPAIALGLGVCTICTAFVHNFAQAAGVRFVLATFDAGLVPGVAYYLSRWYRRSELVFRLSLYFVMAPLAGAFGGLFASAILKLSHIGNLHRWRMIFAVEGIMTCCLSLFAFLTLTERPDTARWLTLEEKNLANARITSERVNATEVLDDFDLPKALRGVASPVTLATSFIFFLNNITVQGVIFFAPTIVQTIYPHSSRVSQQLYTAPPYVVGAFFGLFFPFLAWRLDRRLAPMIASAPLMIIGYILLLAASNAHARYAASFLIAAGAFSFGALCNAHVSANVVSDTARASAIGTTVMFSNLGGLISTWSFLPSDEPRYRLGNGLNLAASGITLVLCVALLAWMRWDNKQRERMCVDGTSDGMDLRKAQDLDWKHPSFRWKL